MSFLGDLFSSGASSLVGSIGKAIDDNVTSDEERLILRNELSQISSALQIKVKEIEKEVELTILKEVTKRQEIDMMSDSWLSKNIRPMSFIYMLIMTTLFTFTDGNLGKFVVKVPWIELWTTLTVAFAVFYAGGRSIEKIKSFVSTRRAKKENLDAYED